MVVVEVAEEAVEALAVRDTLVAGFAEAPLAGEGSGVAGGLQNFGNSNRGGRKRNALDPGPAMIAANRGVSGVLAGHQHTARGSADRSAGIELVKARPCGSETVEVGGCDLLLPEGPDVARAEVIGHDVDDIGPCRRRGGGGKTEREQKREKERLEDGEQAELHEGGAE